MHEDAHHRAAHQSAVAAFTLFALQSREITATIARSVDVATEVVSASGGAVLRLSGARQAIVLHTAGSPALTAGRTVQSDAESLTAPVAPGTVPNSISVVVRVEGSPWGRLLVTAAGSQFFGPADVEFLQMIAAVLGAAVERERVDTGHAALAAFGPFALRSPQLAPVVEKALHTLLGAVDASVGAVVRGVPARPSTLVTVQAAGAAIFAAGVEYEVDQALADAFRRTGPLVVADARTDSRFTSPLLPGSPGLLAYLAPAVVVDGHVWGRLVAGDTRPRSFSDRELEVALSVADMLALALQRQHPGRQHAREADSTAASRASARFGRGVGAGRAAPPPTEIALLDPAGVIVWVNQAWEDFGRDNGADPDRSGIGVNYLATCEAASNTVADEVAAAIRTAVSGDLPAPMRVVIPCHSPRTARWFDVLISSRYDDGGRCVGATVTLSRSPG